MTDSSSKTDRPLTPKQKFFVERYLATWNAVQSARDAGYSHPVEDGWELTHNNPKVQAQIRRRVESVAMSADEVLSRLGEMARASIGDFLILKPQTEEQIEKGDAPEFVLDIQKIQEKGAVVKALVPTAWGTRLELHSAYDALVTIGRNLGLWVDKIAPTDPSGTKPYEPLDDEERAQRILALLRVAGGRREGATRGRYLDFREKAQQQESIEDPDASSDSE